MKYFAVIVAGGSGIRMGSDLPKQFQLLNGKPVLQYSLDSFASLKDLKVEIFVVLPQSYLATWREICTQQKIMVPHQTCYGGETRFHSVRNALDCIDEEGWIAVHDGARPLLSPDLARKCFSEVQTCGAVVPVLPVRESLVMVEENTSCWPVPRKGLHVVQTPQVFHSSLLKQAYLQEYRPSFTDDASVVHAAGHVVSVIPGESRNIKLTYPDDLILASHYLSV